MRLRTFEVLQRLPDMSQGFELSLFEQRPFTILIDLLDCHVGTSSVSKYIIPPCTQLVNRIFK